MSRLDPSRYEGRFYMMPKTAMTLYGCLPGFNASVKLVYMSLLDHAVNDPNKICWPSYYELEFELGLSAKTIRRAIDTLEQYDLIDVMTRPDSRNYTYRVHKPLPITEFARKYPKAFKQWERKSAEIDARKANDKLRLRNWRDKIPRSDGQNSL
jgi:hypothetical protein